MAPKQQLEKAAWKWTENVGPEEVTSEHVRVAYRVDLKACTVCRRNCKGNPNCLVGLGERLWLGEIDDSNFHDIDDPNNDCRQKGSFVGLKNLGATCYVNTFLQVWFHNEGFRKAMYRWRPLNQTLATSKDYHENCEKKIKLEIVNGAGENGGEIRMADGNDGEISSSDMLRQLQLIFALLEHSERRYVDPTPLITCLGLNTGLQQDAQEFSKLFMAILEEEFGKQSDRVVRNLVQNMFSGKYTYITRCNKCGQGSQNLSKFYELDINIQGHHELHQCLGEFLKEENLDGCNQYFCSCCQSKQNATRKIQLTSLPPVLNLQLLRFVFDRNSGHKKKLNTFIQFPEVLDMSPYLAHTGGVPAVYELTAVLIHRGPTAYSGHYIAHIKDPQTSDWHKFNDEEIEKMGGKYLKLGNEDEITDNGQNGVKQPKTVKGYHSSRNAYMLVYYRKEMENDPAPTTGEEVVMPAATAAKHPPVSLSPQSLFTDLPDYIQEEVVKDNQQFRSWIKDMVEMREKKVVNGQERHQEIRSIYGILSPTSEGETEWIPTEWIRKWLGIQFEPGNSPINNSGMLCKHGKLDVHRIDLAKRISKEAAEVMFAKYGGGPRLEGGGSLCTQCVAAQCRVIRTKAQIAQDFKSMAGLTKGLKPEQLGPGSYWVGKQSFRSWRRLATEILEGCHQDTAGTSLLDDDKEEEPMDQTRAGGGDGPDNSPLAVNHMDDSRSTDGSSVGSQGGSEPGLQFNEDLLCCHQQLQTSEGARRLVPPAVWNIFKTYFPTAPEFKFTDCVCPICVAIDKEEEDEKASKQAVAYAQKEDLLQLYHDRNRPSWAAIARRDTAAPAHRDLYVVDKEFVANWRAFLRRPLQRDMPVAVSNAGLICCHGNCVLRPEELVDPLVSDRFLYVWPAEWQLLEQYCAADCTIKVTWTPPPPDPAHPEKGPSSSLMDQLVCTPAVCSQCVESRLREEAAMHKVYDLATIYIRKVVDTKSAIAAATVADALVAVDNIVEENNHDALANHKDPGDSDPEFNHRFPAKGKKQQQQPQQHISAPFQTNTPTLSDKQIRRSTRHHKVRGEKPLIVSSSDSLKDLKVKVMNLFTVAPFDQNILLNGTSLTDPQATLAELGVTPGCTLYLYVDTPTEDTAIMLEELVSASTDIPEEGFKGTGLLAGRT